MLPSDDDFEDQIKLMNEDQAVSVSYIYGLPGNRVLPVGANFLG